MARSISVKVPTAMLIAQLENKIAEIKTAVANYPEARATYEKDLEAYKAKVAEFVSWYVVSNINHIGYEYNSIIRICDRGSKVELEFDTSAIAGFPPKPKSPEEPNAQRWYGRDHSKPLEILEKNLKILKMTSQEEVSASTYGAIMELL
jgi:hypothetical protein